jgi:branched-chain amino acid transport system permease protein
VNWILVGVLLNGILLGGIYALFAVGLTLSFGAMRVFNVAYGALMTFAVVEAALRLTDAPYLVVVLGGILFGGAMGALIELVAVIPLRGRRLSRDQFGETTFLTTLGVLLILDSINFRETKGTYQTSPTTHLLQEGITLGPIHILSGYIVGAAVAVVLISFIAFVVARTQAGRSLRAIAADSGMAALVGIDVRSYSIGSAVVSGMTAGLAGVLLASVFFAFDASFGDTLLLRGFAIVVVAGIGSIAGTLAGGVILGLTENLLGYYGGISWVTAGGPLIIALILVLRPNGLFGRREAIRA